MAKIKIITDSSLDLPKDILDELDLTIMSINISLGDKEYLDLVDISPDDIIDYSIEHHETPRTSCPTFQQVVETLQGLEDDEQAICLLISENSSSSTHMVVNNAIETMNMGDRVKAIDSKSLSSGLGLLVIKADRLIKEGLDLDTIVDILERDVKRLHTGFVVDKLDFLYYGGRCSSLTLMFTGGLKIKPLINMVDGEMKVVKKYRGSLEKVLNKYVKDMASNLDKIDSSIMAIAHTRMDQDLLDQVVAQVENLNYFEEIIVSPASATITSHGGPNTLGLFYFNKEDCLED